ncbi:hypothetical protein [Wenyingzhuangia sp. IMCC45467]
MIKLKFQYFLLIISYVLIISCGGDGNELETDPKTELTFPEKAKLSLPLNGEICTGYTTVPNNDSKAEISFYWERAINTTSYELIISESENIVDTKQTTSTSSKVILDKGKTYSWVVISKNSDGESISTTYSFTTPGEPLGNYVPYAAVIDFTIDKTNNIASLSWLGNDEDSENTELYYDLIVAEDEIEIINIKNTSENKIDNFTAKLNSVYKIEIKTNDEIGSYSISEFNYTFR